MDHVEALRADLRSADFRVDRLDALWGAAAAAALTRGDRVPAARALATLDASAAVLARLFALGLPVGVDALAAVLPALTLDGAVALELVEVDGVEVRPLVDLRPYAFVDARGAGEWWIASDLGELATGRALRVDHVLGVGGASTTLAGLQFADPVDRVLDLGTGCGIQAMHARRFAERVVATDVSERALRFARLNLALNGIDGVELRLGDLFEPVAGETFDRIVSNPPFVITPRTEGVPAYEYRDGGRFGDGLVAAVVAGAAAHLRPGGTAQLLGNWEYRAGADGLERVGGWTDAAGLDVWAIEREQQDPALYAETWIRDGGTRVGDAEFERLCGAWLDDFAARGVEAVGLGYLVLRRPIGAPTVRRLERVATPVDERTGLGDHLQTVLAATDRVGALDDTALLATALRVAGDVTEERSHWPGEADPSVIVLRQGGGLRRELQVDAALAAVVGACDGELPLGVIVDAVAQLLELDPAATRAAVVAEALELVADGVLVPSTGD